MAEVNQFSSIWIKKKYFFIIAYKLLSPQVGLDDSSKYVSQTNLRSIDPYNPYERQSRLSTNQMGFNDPYMQNPGSYQQSRQPSFSRNVSIYDNNNRQQNILNSNLQYPSEVNRGNFFYLYFNLIRNRMIKINLKKRNLFNILGRFYKTALFCKAPFK
jgi:hypothetical protein